MAGTLNIATGLPIDRATVAETGVVMQMPCRIGDTERTLWLLPYEPKIAVRGKNVITRRMIAKRKEGGYGTVKELWTKDDWEVIIYGTLFDHNRPNELPTEYISKLSSLCSLGKPLIIDNALLAALGIGQIAIADYRFPETPGIGYQNFEIVAYSDSNFNLLIEK